MATKEEAVSINLVSSLVFFLLYVKKIKWWITSFYENIV